MAHDDFPPPPGQGRAKDELAEEDEPREKRPFSQILDGLAKPVPARLLQTKRLQGNEITYIPWYRAQKVLQHYTNGFWENEIVEREITGSHILLTVSVTVHAKEGSFTRQATGIEKLNNGGYGDPQSQAESMAFRRAAARFGLALDLYDSDLR